MIADEGLLVMLDHLRSRRMTLRLFTNRPKTTKVASDDFTEAKGYTPKELTKDDWKVEVDEIQISAEGLPMRFSKRVERITGWFLTDTDTGAVMGYEAFEEPYTAYNERFKLDLDITLKLRQPEIFKG